MARIKNIELPKDKNIQTGLTSIYGIGRSLAKTICDDANVDCFKKVNALTEEEEVKLRKEVDKYLVEGELRREVNMNIKNKMEIGSYEGIRHN